MKLPGFLKREKFEGGIEELRPISEAKDVHEAVGLWWAQALLSPAFDNVGEGGSLGEALDEASNQEALRANSFGQLLATVSAAEGKSEIAERITGFAKALAHLSRKGNLSYIGVDYHPDQALRQAAEMSEMPYNEMMTFPWKTNTYNDGVKVEASMGYAAPYEQVWPPVETPSE